MISDLNSLANEPLVDVTGLVDFRKCECLYALAEDLAKSQSKYDTFETVPCVQVFGPS